MSDTAPGTTDLSQVILEPDYVDLDERYRSIFQEHKKQRNELNNRRNSSFGWDREQDHRIQDEGYGTGC